MSNAASTTTRPISRTTDLALIAVFAGLIAAFALAPAIPLGGIGVPITLQTLAVALTGMILGWRRGFLAVLLYIVVGLAGLPIFAGGTAGLAIFAKASVGYLLSFPFAAALAGFLSYRFLDTAKRPAWLWLFGAGLIASAVLVHPAGIVGISTIAHLDLGKAVLADLPFLPGDIVKNLLAALIAAQVHKAFPQLASRG